MRERPYQTALFLLSAALLAPAASAHPVKPGHTAADRETTRAAEAVHASPHGRGKESAKTGERRPTKSSTRVADRRASDRKVVERLVAERRTHNHPVKPRRVEEPKANTKRRHAPLEEARVEPRVEAPASESAAVELPPIQVRHNRKIHLTPEPNAPAPDAVPRRATVEDFLDTPAAPVENDASGAEPSSTAPAAAAPTANHPRSIMERKTPVVKPAGVVVADPVIEPVLYTAHGHLIVPPAMKGSHEILLHQNEMADRDGLIRVQDEDDLDRLRTSRQLVALPASAALEVDERLPVNRRYCRPWTAQFLAAMARAHYARFHSPLQVNSAVRTVEFQERLRYTNGNAAPADGETASPHLTGQAVDVAKHGLSMTEIAWMRGYLMPLVQQGKVDVEEEFQQSCFHISVYKKYMPQTAPKRDIPTRRSPATALAAAIQ